MSKKNKTEKSKSVLSLDRLYKRPIVSIVVIAAITVFFSLQLFRLKIDNNNFNFIPDDDHALVLKRKVDSIFGDDNVILIGIERKFSSIFEKDFIEELRKLDKTINDMPHVRYTLSLVTTEHLEGENGEMIALPLIPENYSGSESEIAELTYKIHDWGDMYFNTLVSEDLKAVQFIIFLDVPSDGSGDASAGDLCKALIKISDEWDFPDSKTYITGVNIFSEVINQATAHDLSFLIPIVIVVVILVLLISFRRFLGVFLPLITVVISVIWALGSMAIFNVPMSILSTVLPVILIAVGSAYGIHLISHYFDEAATKANLTKDENRILVIDSVRKIIRPLTLAALTTFAGFVSFCFTEVKPIREFGIFASLGVMSAFLISAILIPPILILRGPKPIKRNKNKHTVRGHYTIDSFLANTFMIIAGHKRTVFFTYLLLIAVSIVGINNLVIDNILVEYFKGDHILIKADNFSRDHFAGSKQLTLLVEADKPNVVTRPDVLNAVDSLSQYLRENIPAVGSVASVADLVKRLNQVLNKDTPADGFLPSLSTTAEDNFDDIFVDTNEASDDDFESLFGFDEYEEESPVIEQPNNESSLQKNITSGEMMAILDYAMKNTKSDISATDLIKSMFKKVNYNGLTYYEIPNDLEKYGKNTQEELHRLIQDYLSLLTSNTESFMDNALNPKVLKVNLQLKTLGQQDTDEVIDVVENFVKAKFPKDVKVTIGGISLVEKSLNKLVVKSQLISLAISLLIVFLILTIFYKSLLAGIIGIIPLIFSIAINFAVMGFFGIKINIGTSMVASLAVGIGIDYTIHYLDAYHRELLNNKHTGNFLYNTFYGSGKAILFNAISVGAGFAVLLLSDFRMLGDLGLLICLVMVTSSLASLTILPLVLNVLKPRFISKVYKWDRENLNIEE